MKLNTKIVFILFISFSIPSFASRARLLSLQNNNHFLDTETIFEFPTKISELDPFLTIDSGQTVNSNLKDGAFSSGMASIDAKSSVAVSLGRQNNLSSSQRVVFNGLASENFELSQNPIHILWSSKNKGQSWAFGLFHSAKNDKINQQTESTQMIQGGYRTGFLTLAMAIDLVNEVSAAANKKLSLTNSGSFSALYEIDNLTLSAVVQNFSASQKNTGILTNAFDSQEFQLAFSDRTDFDRNHFFYRIDILIKNLKYQITGLKERQNKLPMTLGLESDFSDWLVLRSSLQQTVLVNQFENQPAGENTTSAAFGAGFKFKNVIIDGTFSGLIGSAQSTALNPNNFLSQVAVTSQF
jgi:hypothetical protein